jgi:hypothetical protein
MNKQEQVGNKLCTFSEQDLRLSSKSKETRYGA